MEIRTVAGGSDTSTSVTSTATAAPRAPLTTTTPPRPAGPLTTIDTDGTYLIGQDVVPGRYRTAGPVRAGRDCYFKRLASLDSSDIIDNEGTLGPQVVDIMPTDTAFATTNCQPWQKIG